jgi:hypothetical protein
MEAEGTDGSSLFIERGMAQALEDSKETLGGDRLTFSSGSGRSRLPFSIAGPA